MKPHYSRFTSRLILFAGLLMIGSLAPAAATTAGDLMLYPPVVGVSAREGDNAPVRYVYVRTAAGCTGAVTYTVATDSDWFTVTPTNGVSSTNQMQRHWLHFSTTNLPAGVHTGQLAVAGTSSTNAPVWARVTLHIYPVTNMAPIAVVRANPPSGVAPLAVHLYAYGSTDPDGSIANYAWDLGDGQTASGFHASHLYTNPATYTVTLTVTDNDGASASTNVSIEVRAPDENRTPVAVAHVYPTEGTAPLSVKLLGSSSIDYDGTITNYTWDLGDGQSADAPNAWHTYSNAGSYAAILTVTDDDGATNSARGIITVHPAASNRAPIAVCRANPLEGRAPLQVTFSGWGSHDPDGRVVVYLWDFGNGTSATGATSLCVYSNAGTYRATLTIEDDDQALATNTVSVTVHEPATNRPPLACLAVTPGEGIAPLIVRCSGGASLDTDGTITNYAWSFGDGQEGLGRQTTHTYSNAGVYTVALTVTDDDGDTDTASTDVTVHEPAANQPPVAAIYAGRTEGLVPLAVYLSGRDSSDPDGVITNYEWVSGDGRTASGVSTHFVYTNAGNYKVRLIVTDDDNATDTAELDVTAYETNYPPIARIHATPLWGEAPLEVAFDASDSRDSDGTLADYAWDFGDGVTAGNGTNALARHAYTNAGIYQVVLTVTDDDGLSDEAATSIRVNPPILPRVVARAFPSSGSAELRVHLVGYAAAAAGRTITNKVWDFGDGTSETTTNGSAVHTYTEAATYRAVLTATDSAGLSGSNGVSIVVTNGPAGPDPMFIAGRVTYTGDATGTLYVAATSSGATHTTSLSEPGPYAITNLTGPALYQVVAWVDADGNAARGVTEPWGHASVHLTTSVSRIHITLTDTVVAEAGGPYRGFEGSPITFNAARSRPRAAALLFRWSFGDGGETPWSPRPYASHRYADDGAYTLTLHASNRLGTASDTSTVHVANVAPTVRLHVSTPVTVVGDTVVLTAESRDPAGTNDPPLYAFWANGTWTGWAATNQTSVTFTNWGLKRVCARVSDGDGDTGQTCRAIAVRPPLPAANTPPVAVIADPAITVSAPGEAVVLDGSGSYDPDGHTPLRFLWRELPFNPDYPVLTNRHVSVVAFTPETPGTYRFGLVVLDARHKQSRPVYAKVRAAGIKGTVYVADANQRLVVPRARVSVDIPALSTNMVTFSDAKGRFELVTGFTNALTYVVTHAGYETNSASFVPSAGEIPVDIFLTTSTNNLWRGRVVDSVTGEGVPGAVLHVGLGSGFRAITKTGFQDTVGEFSMLSPPPGTNRVAVWKPGYHTGLFEQAFPNSEYQWISLVPRTTNVARRVYGHVYAAHTRIPLEGVSVSVDPQTGTNNVETAAVTDSSGYYDITNVLSGTHLLVAEREYPADEGNVIRQVSRIYVSPYKDTIANIYMRGGIRVVYGEVVDQDGNAISNAVVRHNGAVTPLPEGSGESDGSKLTAPLAVGDEPVATDPDGDDTIVEVDTTDEAGFFTLQLPEGTRLVQFVAEGHEDTWIEVDAAADSDASISLMSTGNTDSNDNDHLPDWWEKDYFSLATSTNADSGDFDKDGMSNYEEYRARTDPTQGSSRLGLTTVKPTPQGFSLKWDSTEGSFYSIDRADVVGVFSVIASNLWATAPTNSYTDTNVVNKATGFYRIVVE